VSADVNPDSPAEKAGVSLPVIAAAAVALVALLAFLGYQAFTPKFYAPPAPPTRKSNPNEDAFNAWARQKYNETNGNWSKLSSEDQQRFTVASRGKGKDLFDTFKSPK
jgi:hypothetical protein